MQLIYAPNAILKQKSRPVSMEELGQEISDQLQEMRNIISQHSALGLAAPQIGDLRRIIVVDVRYGLTGMINPEVIWFTAHASTIEEQCLSITGFQQEVTRPRTIGVRWLTEQGEVKEADFSDLEAHVIQHEIDHLDGITLLEKSGKLKKSRYLQRISKQEKTIRRQIKKLLSEANL